MGIKVVAWLVGAVLLFGSFTLIPDGAGHFWKYYVAPGYALESAVNRCEFDAHKLYAQDIAKAGVDLSALYDPYRRVPQYFFDTRAGRWRPRLR
jgi:hypothetical protein